VRLPTPLIQYGPFFIETFVLTFFAIEAIKLVMTL